MNLNMSVARPAGIFALALPRMVGKFSRNEYAARLNSRRGLPVRLSGHGFGCDEAAVARGAAATARPATADSFTKSRRENWLMGKRGGLERKRRDPTTTVAMREAFSRDRLSPERELRDGILP